MSKLLMDHQQLETSDDIVSSGSFSPLCMRASLVSLGAACTDQRSSSSGGSVAMETAAADAVPVTTRVIANVCRKQ